MNDPVKGCPVYRNEGCSHVDGYLCDYPECDIMKQYVTEDPIRQAFEDITYSTLNIAGTRTGYGLRRKPNGEYVSDLLEDHWNTFQEGWECALEHMKKQRTTPYSDIVSDGGIDPRERK